jgi:cytochrome c
MTWVTLTWKRSPGGRLNERPFDWQFEVPLQLIMGCVECHDPHQNERGQVALFSQRCLACHQQEHCGKSEELGARLAENCIDCHMPTRATANLRVETTSGNLFPPLRDHYIRVDTEATKEYLNGLSANE